MGYKTESVFSRENMSGKIKEHFLPLFQIFETLILNQILISVSKNKF